MWRSTTITEPHLCHGTQEEHDPNQLRLVQIREPQICKFLSAHDYGGWEERVVGVFGREGLDYCGG